MRYGSGALFSGMLFMLSFSGTAASDSGWSFFRAGDTISMQHSRYGSLMLEQRDSLDAYRFIHSLEDREKCKVVEKEYYIKAENCRGFSVIEAVQSARVQGDDNPTGIFYLNPSDRAGLEQLYFVVASLSGNREGSFSVFLDFLAGWKLEFSPREQVIRDEQTRVERLNNDYDQIDYWEYHVRKPGIYTYTFSHAKTGLRIVFENAGYLIKGDTVHNISQRLARKYGCDAPVSLPDGFYKNDDADSDHKKQEIKFPYVDLQVMECLNNVRVFVADNGGGIFYDYVVKLPTPPAELKTEEKVPEGAPREDPVPEKASEQHSGKISAASENGGSNAKAGAAEKESDSVSDSSPVSGNHDAASSGDTAGASESESGDAARASEDGRTGEDPLAGDTGSDQEAPEDDSGKRTHEYEILVQEFIRKTEIFNPAL